MTPPAVLPSRHIHLDFHTSPGVTAVGDRFDAEDFAGTLASAGVRSITVFAKCHHGMAYFPATHAPQHPGLDYDLLGAQVAACHSKGIQVAAYISVMYDQAIWNTHPEWRCLDRSGTPVGLTGPAGPVAGELGKICLNSPYLDTVVALAEEVVSNYDVDGLFFDNVQYGDWLGEGAVCFCVGCVEERRHAEIAPDDLESSVDQMRAMILRQISRLFGVAEGSGRGLSCFVNGQLVDRAPGAYVRQAAEMYAHLEVESLPGGHWGYEHFPIAVRSMRALGVDLIGMTGSFHRSWGDFGTVRELEATSFECFTMLALGTKVSVGDHLHPSGQLNPLTYERIGAVYAAVEDLEPWTRGAVPAQEVAVIVDVDSLRSPMIRGVTRMLSELRMQFEFVAPTDDLSPYHCLVLPDECPVIDDLTIRDFVTAGGTLLVTGQAVTTLPSAITAELLGVERTSLWPHDVQYVALAGLDSAPFPTVAYVSGPVLTPTADADVVATYWRPSFNNDYVHFQVEQAPPATSTGEAAIVQTPIASTIGPNIFTDYAISAYAGHRSLVADALSNVLPEPLVSVTGPHALQAHVTLQGTRMILHLLYFVPVSKARGVEVVEDLVPVHDVQVSLRVATDPLRVYEAPLGTDLPFSRRGERIDFVVPLVSGYAVIAIETQR